MSGSRLLRCDRQSQGSTSQPVCRQGSRSTIKHSDEQLAAAADLLADGATTAEAARILAEQFGVSLRTGQRIVSAVSCDMSDTVPECDTASTDYLALALQSMAQAVRAAAQAGDHDALAARSEQLAGMIAKTKVRFAP